MKALNASELLAALGQESRVSIFRLRIEAGREGMKASAIAEQLGVVPATLSFHLAHLSRAGLFQGRTESRFIRCSADYPLMDKLIAFFTNNCCQAEACLAESVASNSAEKGRSRIQKISPLQDYS